MPNARLDEAQAGIKIAGRNINNLRHADDTILMAESEEELKSLLMKVKKLTWNSTFKKLRSWHQVPLLHGKWLGKHRKQWETLFFLAPIPLQMVTVTRKLKDICSLGKSYEQTRGHIKNQRHYFTDKGPSDQSYGFPSNHV